MTKTRRDRVREMHRRRAREASDLDVLSDRVDDTLAYTSKALANARKAMVVARLIKGQNGQLAARLSKEANDSLNEAYNTMLRVHGLVNRELRRKV
jgi:hypothetical protein